MRVYRNTAEAIISALYDVFVDGQYVNYIVPKVLKSNKKWGSKDRRFVAEAIYEITRFWNFHQYSAQQETVEEKEQIWPILASYLVVKNNSLPDWKEFTSCSIDEIIQRQNKAQSIFVLQQSLPDWLHELGINQLGQEVWENEVIAQNQEADVVLRINSLAFPSNTIEERKAIVSNSLAELGVTTKSIENYPDALQLIERKSIVQSKAYKQGWIEIQDANSQLVAPFCHPKENQIIIDACTGAGGKSLHLAAVVNNDADIYSLDVNPLKIEELEKRLLRANATCIEAGLVVDFSLIDYAKQADVVLIDAPCSGIGTMKHEADKKWKLTPEFMEEITKLQQQVLLTYSPLVKPGGILVYATCSIFPMENQMVVQDFLQSKLGANFQLDEEQTVLPSKTGFDGFYMARMIHTT